jgi:hypothetical protein
MLSNAAIKSGNLWINLIKNDFVYGIPLKKTTWPVYDYMYVILVLVKTVIKCSLCKTHAVR